MYDYLNIRASGDTPSMKVEGVATLDLAATADEEAGEKEEKKGPARFRMTANTGSPMKLQGWKYPVVMDLEGIGVPHQQIPIRLDHDPRSGVGHTESVGVEGGKLLATGVISRSTDAARDVRESARQGFPWRASIGASADQVEFVKAGQKVVVNGQEYEGPVNVARRSTLGEISFVDLGADPLTDALVAKTDAGDALRIAAAAGKDGEGDSGDESSVEAGRRKLRQSMEWIEKENERQDQITALAVQYAKMAGVDIREINKIAAQAVEEHWTRDQAELHMLRRTRAQPRTPAQPPAPPSVVEAGLCMFLGISDEKLAKDRDYGPDVVQAAWGLRGRGLCGTIAAAIEATGRRMPYRGNEFYNAVLDYQRQGSIQASSGGFSTVNLPGILGNVANKVLIEAFTRVDATYDRIADQADFSNFYTHSIYRLQATGDFTKVPPDGELKHGSLEQDAYTNKLDTYGVMLTITRQDIINDDLNAFRSLTSQLGRNARIAVENALYLLICESSDVFYTTARGNRLTGSLGVTELGLAEAAMLAMADVSGKPIYATPRFLVVPPALKSLANSLFLSDLLQGATSSTRGQPAANPFKGRFEVVSSPFLSNSTVPGNSTSTWYLLADPLVLPAFQVAYLDGRRAPTVETADALFNTLGLQMRCFWDFGISQLDYRGANKNTAT